MVALGFALIAVESWIVHFTAPSSIPSTMINLWVHTSSVVIGLSLVTIGLVYGIVGKPRV